MSILHGNLKVHETGETPTKVFVERQKVSQTGSQWESRWRSQTRSPGTGHEADATFWTTPHTRAPRQQGTRTPRHQGTQAVRHRAGTTFWTAPGDPFHINLTRENPKSLWEFQTRKGKTNVEKMHISCIEDQPRDASQVYLAPDRIAARWDVNPTSPPTLPDHPCARVPVGSHSLVASPANLKRPGRVSRTPAHEIAPTTPTHVAVCGRGQFKKCFYTYPSQFSGQKGTGAKLQKGKAAKGKRAHGQEGKGPKCKRAQGKKQEQRTKGHQGTSASEHWAPEHRCTRAPKHHGRAAGQQGTRVPGHQSTRAPGHRCLLSGCRVSDDRCPVSSVWCVVSGVWCPVSDGHSPMSGVWRPMSICLVSGVRRCPVDDQCPASGVGCLLSGCPVVRRARIVLL